MAECEKQGYTDVAIDHTDILDGSGATHPRRVEVTPGYHFLAAGADLQGLETPDRDENGEEYVEILCPGHSAKLLVNEAPPEGMCVRLRFYLTTDKKAVVDRDTDLLTPEEYVQNAEAVRAGSSTSASTGDHAKTLPTSLMSGGWVNGNE